MRASKKNEGWDNKPSGKFRQVITWTAVLIILLAGYMSVSMVKPLLPDYRDEVVVYEKTERNSPIYLQSDDSISIYPWDEYDEAGLLSLAQYKEILEPDEVEYIGTVESYGDAADTFVEVSDFLAAWVIIKREAAAGIEDAITCDARGEAVEYYLKDYRVNSSGTEYQTSLFFSPEMEGFFYHYQRTDTGQVSSDMINTAHKELQAAITEIEKLYRDLIDDKMAVTITESQIMTLIEENPIVRAWYRLVEMGRHGYTAFAEEYLVKVASILYQSGQDGGSYDIVVYQGELLAVFADDTGDRLVVFYDPIQEEVSGISVKIGR